ncbi:MAG: tetratricopeptide repeat protein [Gammaproteobacteria bacterium]|nr:tetratricopeptide repeat protein [Gammaproteobacteria bacterium]
MSLLMDALKKAEEDKQKIAAEKNAEKEDAAAPSEADMHGHPYGWVDDLASKEVSGQKINEQRLEWLDDSASSAESDAGGQETVHAAPLPAAENADTADWAGGPREKGAQALEWLDEDSLTSLPDADRAMADAPLENSESLELMEEPRTEKESPSETAAVPSASLPDADRAMAGAPLENSLEWMDQTGAETASDGLPLEKKHPSEAPAAPPAGLKSPPSPAAAGGILKAAHSAPTRHKIPKGKKVLYAVIILLLAAGGAGGYYFLQSLIAQIESSGLGMPSQADGGKHKPGDLSKLMARKKKSRQTQQQARLSRKKTVSPAAAPAPPSVPPPATAAPFLPEKKTPAPPPPRNIVPHAPKKAAPVSVLPPEIHSTRIKITHKPAPQRIPKQLQKAYAAYQSGNNKTAAREYRRILKTDARNRSALLGLAAIAMRNGERQKARNYYFEVLRLYPRDPLAEAGLLTLTNENNELANLSRLSTLVAKNPQAPYLHFALGNLYSKQGRWAEAQQAYFDAYRYDNTLADYAYNLAVSLDYLGKPRAALTYYQKALDLSENQSAHFNSKTVTLRIGVLAGEVDVK